MSDEIPLNKNIKISNEINKINFELNKLYEDEYADENLFNLGIRFGRLLESQKSEDIALDFFLKQTEKADFSEAIDNQVSQIKKILKLLVLAAMKMELNLSRNGCWHINTDSYSNDQHKLKEEVVEKYKIQVTRVHQASHESDLDITFTLEGKLREIFSAAGLNVFFQVSYSNDDGDYINYLEEDNLNRSFNPNIQIKNTKDADGLAKITEAQTSLSKETLFLILAGN